MINIPREIKDPHYRYKMPRLVTKIEGKGNGVKTIILNLPEIAKALNRRPIYLIKYLGIELGAQVNSDELNSRYIINGNHDAEKLQSLLDSFIKRFVLCASCSNPETGFIFGKNDGIRRDCKGNLIINL
jgi:translation initiation factor 5